MIFFSVKEILISLLLSAVSGFIFGALYMASDAIFSSIKEMLFLLPRAIRNISKFSFKSRSAGKEKKPDGALFVGIFDFLSFLFFGICYIITNYLTLDGVFRLYSLIFTVVFFFIAKKTVGRAFAICYGRVFNFLYLKIFVIFSVIILPIYKLMQKAKRVILKILQPIERKIQKIRSEKLVRKKLGEIEGILKKAGLTN